MKQNLILIIGFLIAACSSESNKTSDQANTTNVDETLLKTDLIIGERINGPANIRDTINGKILFELLDNTLVETTPIENGWLSIGIFVKLTEKQLENFQILPGTDLLTTDNKIVGKAKDTIDVWMGNDQDHLGLIGGFTFKDNINPQTIPENILGDLLNQKQFTKEKLNDFIQDFQFEEYNIGELPNIKQLFIYQSLIVDISPRDRITLLFRKDSLIGVIHSRQLPENHYKTYELIRGHKLTIIADLTPEEIEDLRQRRIEFYRSVD